MLIAWLHFFAGAVFILFAGIKLTKNADSIAKTLGLSAGWAGVFLLPLATSLPELTASLRALIIGSPDLAVGNLLGSNLFNITIIALIDLLQGRGSLFVKIKKGHVISMILGILLAAVCAAGIIFPFPKILGWLGLDTVLIFFIYLSAVFLFTRHERQQSELEETYSKNALMKIQEILKPLSVFIISAFVILLACIVLTDAADVIAVETGWGRTFVGSIMLAVATTMPELVTVSTAARMGKFDMAVGNILGANILNIFILFILDFLYLPAPLMQVVSQGHIITAVMVMGITFLAVIGLISRSEKSIGFLSSCSILILIGYLAAVSLLFLKGN